MAERICTHPDCTAPHYGRGWCRLHYNRWKVHGDPDKVIARTDQNRRSDHERFLSKVPLDAPGCWVWQGSLDKDGYGRFTVARTGRRAHRWAYEHYIGPIPPGYEIDHLCGRPSCVRPSHLEAVPPSENLSRRRPERMSASAKARPDTPRGTHCAAGLHEMTGRNVIEKANGRECRACRNDRARANYRAKVARPTADMVGFQDCIAGGYVQDKP